METDSEGFYQVGVNAEYSLIPFIPMILSLASTRSTHVMLTNPLSSAITFNHLSRVNPHFQVQEGHSAIESACRVMAFARDMMRCSKEVRGSELWQCQTVWGGRGGTSEKRFRV